jgi:uncharacterized membrane protein
MPLVLPLLLCLAGILIASLPPHEIQPEPATRGNWAAMAVATAAVVGLIVFVVIQLDRRGAEVASGTPSAAHPSERSAL